MIVSGFAGIGKTKLSVDYPNMCKDLESSHFKWLSNSETTKTDEKSKGDKSRILNPEWPDNYVKAIKDANEKFNYVFISMDKEVRNKLDEENIRFFLAFPSKDCKEDYLQRYRSRGNMNTFISLIEKNWDSWIDDLYADSHSQIRLHKGEFLSDKLPKLS